MLSELYEDIRTGRSISEAMSRHPEAFSTMYCRMIRVGEQTGHLEAVLWRVADYMERESALLSKVARALTYPAFVLLIAGGVITLLVTFVIPSFGILFEEFDGDVPLPTRLLIGASSFLTQHKLFLIALTSGVLALTVWSLKNYRTRRRLDALLLKLPLIGSIITLSEMARCCRLVSLGLSESLPRDTRPATLCLKKC